MAIKQDYAINRTELNDALIKLRLNISEVSRETKIPRTYINEFRNGDRVLRPEYLGKLKDYFESKGIVFEDDSPKPENPPQTQVLAVPQAAALYRFMPVYLEADQPAVIKTQNIIQDNDARMALLLQQTAVRNDGFMSDGEFTHETKETFHEVLTLMALSYALQRSLSGWPALGLSPGSGDVETIRDVIFESFSDQFKNAGLFVEPSNPIPNELGNENEDESA